MLKNLLRFLRITIAGGILFLLPIVVLIIILKKVYSFLGGLIENSSIADYTGPISSTVITIIFLLLICFLAGLLMRTRTAQKLVEWLEDRVLVYIPGYTFIKTVSSSQVKKDASTEWKTASVFIDDNEVICFVIDESEHYCSIFLPSAPSPSSGTVCVREKDKVKYLPIKMAEAFLLIKQFGKGAAVHIEKLMNPNEKSVAANERINENQK